PEYLEFIVKDLKPYIDKHYRTRKNRQNTFIAGSSMGGLISMYAILKYPKVFGGAGVFSPAFWVNPEIQNYTKEYGKRVKGKIYFYAGKQESDEMVADMQEAYNSLKEVSKARLQIIINENGKHNETTWRNEFPEFYYWLMKGKN
ncbi:MAG TPA: alpha/beta hydrolase-fold protein, partial [Chitinophagaceae bacterium]|nr:alpha/beta hydrolase-fold protein [Chitinophagaceae bacterium]